MKITFALTSIVLAAALLTACGGHDAAPPAPGPVAAPKTAPVADAVGPEGLLVSADGTEFAPPVAPELLPDGVWYCDMGTVHYARVTEGDGRCPLCGMYLKQYHAEAPEEDEAHEGHEHEG